MTELLGKRVARGTKRRATFADHDHKTNAQNVRVQIRVLSPGPFVLWGDENRSRVVPLAVSNALFKVGSQHSGSLLTRAMPPRAGRFKR